MTGYPDVRKQFKAFLTPSLLSEDEVSSTSFFLIFFFYLTPSSPAIFRSMIL